MSVHPAHLRAYGPPRYTTYPKPSDKVYAFVASQPKRASGLATVVKALRSQVDHVYVYLNNWPDVPEFLRHERISTVRSQDEGDRGVGGKLYWSESLDGFHVVVDDDFFYPPNYVGKLIDCVERHGRRVIATVHGAQWRSSEPQDYYEDRRTFVSTEALHQETLVHLTGTGTMAYHSSCIRFARERMPRYGVDLACSIDAQRAGVPIVAVERAARWLWMNPCWTVSPLHMAGKPAIRDELSAKLRAVSPWRLHAPPS